MYLYYGDHQYGKSHCWLNNVRMKLLNAAGKNITYPYDLFIAIKRHAENAILSFLVWNIMICSVNSSKI